MIPELTPEATHQLYAWIDEIPLNRPKRHIARDFSDGVATAEVVKYYVPKLVDMHNYSPANGIGQKLYNWNTLTTKVLKKMSYVPSEELIQGIVNNRTGYVEVLLYELREKLDQYMCQKNIAPPKGSPSPDALQRQASGFSAGAAPSPMGSPMGSPVGSVVPSAGLQRPGFQHPLYPPQPVAMPVDPQRMMQQQLQIQAPHQAPQPDKDHLIGELQDTVQILQLKVSKLEQLLVLKTRHIEDLEKRLGLSGPSRSG